MTTATTSSTPEEKPILTDLARAGDTDSQSASLAAGSDTQQIGDLRGWFEDYREALAENDRRERQLLALYELWRSAPHTEADRLLQRLTERAVELLDAHAGSLLIRERREEDVDTLRVVASVGLPRAVAESALQRVGERIAGRVAATGQPLLVNHDPLAHPQLAAAIAGSSGRAAVVGITHRPEVESALCLPLLAASDIGGYETLGVLCISRFAPAAPFTEADLRIGALFATQAGATLGQGGAFENRPSIARSAAEMADQIGNHRSLIALGQMAATVSHELRNPLSSIKGAAQYLLQEYGGDDAKTTTLRDFLTIVVDEADGLDRMTTDLLDFAKPRMPRTAPTDLAELISTEVAFLRREIQAIGVEDIAELYETSAHGDSAIVLCDRGQLGRALRNLLLNAAQAAAHHEAADGGPARIAVTLKPVTNANDSKVDEWMISISDSGPGVPNDLREKLWEPFFTTKARGTGLGLATVKQVAELHGGRVTIDTAELSAGGGARFSLNLPVEQSA